VGDARSCGRTFFTRRKRVRKCSPVRLRTLRTIATTRYDIRACLISDAFARILPADELYSLTRDGRVTPDAAGRPESGRELVLADDDVRRPRGQFHVVVQIVQGRRTGVIVPGAERYSYLVCNGPGTDRYPYIRRPPLIRPVQVYVRDSSGTTKLISPVNRLYVSARYVRAYLVDVTHRHFLR